MPELFAPTIDDLIRCAERELAMRERVYPHQVAAGRMRQVIADRELGLMRAIAEQLRLDRDGRTE
jgi:hypothetical protein